MFLKKFLLVLALIFSGEVLAINKSAWDNNNDPNLITSDTNTTFEYNFQNLPLEGQLDFTPWADTYWPSFQRGIANRWYGNTNVHVMPYKNKVMSMSNKDLKKLSPAEKYDIFVGDYKYSLTKSELDRTSPKDPQWEGLCHGWAMAALLWKEPNSVIMENEDGIKIPFGASDIKALLIYLQANSDTKEYMAGTRCEQDLTVISFKDRDDACMDINAGAFHVILTNRVGILKKGFVMDVDTGKEVWNQPVYAYTTKIIKTHGPTKNAAEGTVKEIQVQTTVTYTGEIAPSFESPLENPVQREYKYILELNSDDRIIGGKWISEDYPDFIWVQKKAKFTEQLKALEEIYNSSIH